ncbi:hypothetical protein DYBT9623_05349 [Dyadobacter sp. CECT 9623]|uniref:Uncharacterized protein n=1 Tax=Dyadobacter linearis TaxID=2823330 RepID=A0ABM8UYB0_9BACT|nr:hypothetical protein [Dyadobacter sp. CECT 9623]CAG5074662.1 hypothetical protein DYBT9623_05349 [Dyadobacter sp. CECT 9623]
MEFNFTVTTQKAELITKEEYRLYWLGNNNSVLPDNIGTCKVQLDDNQVNCSATITTGGIRHTLNDATIAEFVPNDVLEGKCKYGIMFKNDINGNEYVYGFFLES